MSNVCVERDAPWVTAAFLAAGAALEGAGPGAAAAGLAAVGLGAEGAASAGTELPQPILVGKSFFSALFGRRNKKTKKVKRTPRRWRTRGSGEDGQRGNLRIEPHGYMRRVCQRQCESRSAVSIRLSHPPIAPSTPATRRRRSQKRYQYYKVLFFFWRNKRLVFALPAPRSLSLLSLTLRDATRVGAGDNTREGGGSAPHAIPSLCIAREEVKSHTCARCF